MYCCEEPWNASEDEGRECNMVMVLEDCIGGGSTSAIGSAVVRAVLRYAMAASNGAAKAWRMGWRSDYKYALGGERAGQQQSVWAVQWDSMLSVCCGWDEGSVVGRKESVMAAADAGEREEMMAAPIAVSDGRAGAAGRVKTCVQHSVRLAACR